MATQPVITKAVGKGQTRQGIIAGLRRKVGPAGPATPGPAGTVAKDRAPSQAELAKLYAKDPYAFHDFSTNVGLDPNTGKNLVRKGKITFHAGIDPADATGMSQLLLKNNPELANDRYTVEYDTGWDQYNAAVAGQRTHVSASARNARAAGKAAAQSTFLVAPQAVLGQTDTKEKLGAPKKLGSKPILG